MADNTDLGKAKSARKDEFYTQLTDIEKEMKYYRKHFKDKVVLCNCDDPFESDFFKYFVLNFNRLGLKKLLATSYTGSPIVNKQLSIYDIIGEAPKDDNTPYKAVVTKVYDANGDESIDMLDVEELFRIGENNLTVLEGDGDFRSAECLEMLKEADIVVTNPPFSLFREYVSVLMEKEKKFLIIGNLNAIHYKEIFPLFKDNKLWLGVTMDSSNRYFRVPDNYELTEKTGKIIDGVKYAFVKGCLWFTNIDNKNRHEDIILVKRYSEEDYPKYENYDAINVNAVNDIPCDYPGFMRVPDSFLRKFNPDQFEIIGLGSGYLGQSIGVKGIPKEHKSMMRGHSTAGDLYYLIDNIPKVPYSRIIIRNKHPEERRS